VDADAPAAIGGVTEKASSISVVAASSMEKARTVGQRQIGGSTGASTGREIGAAGEVLEQEAAKVKSWDDASAPQASSRRAGDWPLSAQAASRALVSQAVAVGLVEQLRTRGLSSARAGGREEFVAHALDGGSLLALLLEPGQRGLEDLGGALRKRPRPLRWK
jgi:hypothetical protein